MTANTVGSVSSSSVSAGGAGGSTASTTGSTGGATVCAPGVKEPCFDGPPDAADVGSCRRGERVCNSAGTAFGSCEGQTLPSHDYCNTSEDEDCDGANDACAKEHAFSARFGPAAFATRVALTPSGGVVVAGYATGTIDLGGGPLAGGSDEDIFVLGLDAAGKPTLGKRYGDGENQRAAALAVDASGGLIIGAEVTGAVDFGGGPVSCASRGVVLAKLEADGTPKWVKAFCANKAKIGGAGVDSLGRVVVGGTFTGTIDFGGGAFQATSTQSSAFVAVFDSAGGHITSKAYGSKVYDVHLAINAAGDIALAGGFQGQLDFGGGVLPASAAGSHFVARLSVSAAHVFSRSFDMGSNTVGGIAIDSSGAVALTGNFDTPIDLGNGAVAPQANEDVFLARFGSDGNLVSSARFATSGFNYAGGLSYDAAGGIALIGTLNGSADFGGGPLTSKHAEAVFVARFDSKGSHVSSAHFAMGSGRAIDASTTGVALAGSAGAKLDLGGGLVDGTGSLFVAKFIY